MGVSYNMLLGATIWAATSQRVPSLQLQQAVPVLWILTMLGLAQAAQISAGHRAAGLTAGKGPLAAQQHHAWLEVRAAHSKRLL